MDEIVINDKLKEKVELSILFDFYGELLKGHNKHIFEDHILNDLSLSEIGEENGISRQGVFDIVKRCSKQLRECEEKLHLVKKFEMTKQQIGRIREISQTIKSTNDTKEIDLLIQLTDNILNDL